MRSSSSSWSEQRLHRLLFEQSSDAIVVVDDDGVVMMANRAARELPGVDVDSLFRWSPGRDPEMVSFRAQLRVGSHATCVLPLPAALEGGAPRQLALEGRSYGPYYAVVLRDVSQQRRLEEELRHLRRLESVGYLTASVVHDFNNVLTAMVCSGGLLAKLASGEEASDLGRELTSAGERATGLVRRLMRVLRREPADAQRVNVGNVVREARGLLALLVGPTIEVRLEIDPATADVVVDREQLEQVLLNLAANARDAMPRGGEIVVATSNVRVGDAEPPAGQRAPARAPESGYVAVTVSDTGVGMTAEVRERVFERFFTTKDVGEGAGIGLASAHRFATDAGGCITVRSTPGAGTSVLLYLPRAAGTSAADMPRDEPANPVGREAVLVVEGDDHVRFVVRAALMDRGYFVVDAPTGELGLRIATLAERPVDLVLADVAAPGLSGREIAKELRKKGHPAALLWTSGLTDRATEEHGVTDEPVLRKAFTPSELARRVREALDEAKSVQP
jgi:two-component system cell cycle sensor histidine kinase/response regulator CckA